MAALYVIFFSLVRPHMSLQGKTQVMAAEVAARRWSLEDVAVLLPRKTGPRGPYRKR